MAENYLIHNDDIIFNRDSLEAFIKLIKRQGINNLDIYSVNDDLLANDKWTTIKTADGKDEFYRNNNTCKELNEKKGYILFINKSKPFGIVNNNNDNSNDNPNILSKRHLYVKSLGDINFYGHSNYTTAVSATNSKPTTVTNGTFVAELNNSYYKVPIQGFNTNGVWTGTCSGAITGKINAVNKDDSSNPITTGTTGQFLRGGNPQAWTNTLEGSFYADKGNIKAGGKTWNSTSEMTANTAERSNGVIGGSGSIYFYSRASSASNTYKRGIYGYDSSGNDQDILSFDTSNNMVIGSKGVTSVIINKARISLVNSNGTTGTTSQFWRGDNSWSNELLVSNSTTGPNLNLKNTYLNHEASGSGSFGTINFNTRVSTSDNALANVAFIQAYAKANKTRCLKLEVHSSDSEAHSCNLLLESGTSTSAVANSFGIATNRATIYGVLQADRVYGAVFNDYAEYRTTIDLEPGRVVIDNDNGSLSCSSERLQPGAQVISDTFGHSMGATDEAQTPLAVAGRVLVYTYQSRENYHAGMAVCSAPNGTVDIMTRAEIKEYPDCIVGIVSEIPQYEEWGTNKVKVDGRIWIKVK